MESGSQDVGGGRLVAAVSSMPEGPERQRRIGEIRDQIKAHEEGRGPAYDTEEIMGIGVAGLIEHAQQELLDDLGLAERLVTQVAEADKDPIQEVKFVHPRPHVVTVGRLINSVNQGQLSTRW